MPQTLAGWILFTLVIVSGGASIATAIKLIMSVLGKASQDRRDFHAAYIFGTLLVIATVLLFWFEPTPT
jgi:hypothetical protein